MSKRKRESTNVQTKTKVPREGLKLKDFPQRFEQFDEKRNKITKVKAGEYPAGRKKKYWWRCQKTNCPKKCEHFWETSVKYQTQRKVDCPYCAHDVRYICICNSIAGKRPDMLKIWDYENNQGVDPKKLGIWSNIRVSFVCCNSTCEQKCIHRWTNTVHTQTKSLQVCQFCEGKNVCPCRSFYNTNERLRHEWHPDKNKHLDPFSISFGSDISAWWLCPETSCENKCLHEWQAAISYRAKYKNCPYCSKKRICECNSFFFKRKDLMLEWDAIKNKDLDPKQLKVGSGRKVWWKCSLCSYSWQTVIAARSYGVGKGCRKCNQFSGELSKGAKEVEKVLKDLKDGCVPGFILDYKSEHPLPGMVRLGPLRVDQYVTSPSLKRPAVIEYDGEQHFRKEYEKKWITIVRCDLAKNKYLVQHRIHVLRISYKYPKHKFRNLIHNFLGDALFHEQTSGESYLKCSCPEIYKKLRDDSLPFIIGAKK